VWRNPELSTSVPVRPDGKISIPLIEDLQAAGRKPTDLARGIEDKLKQFVENPIVTVVVESFVGVYGQQVKVVGEAAQPKAVPYRAGMTVLDLMIDVGGLTKFAAGNRAVLTRKTTDGVKTYTVKLDDLLKDGELKRNVPLMPGDTLIIPQSWF
jgi:polysaccharide export outer membrane protein